MITPQDKELLTQKGISEEQIAEQLACFEKGFPYLKLAAAASLEKGILAPAADEQKLYLDAWDAYTRTDKVVVKFVPASGAASRMFKNLFEFLGADYDAPETKFEKTFFEQIEKFAFYDDLNAACEKMSGKDISALVSEGNYKAVVAALLEAAGLNYGALPKGLLKFHRYEDGNRTPLEEHLVEGALYAANKNGKVNVHFTVSPEHRRLFEALVADKAAVYAKKYGVDYNVTFSEQKPSIDRKALETESSGKLKISLCVNAILVVCVVAMFAMTLTSDSPTIVDYQSKLLNRYASWEQELTEREKAVSEKEQELGIQVDTEQTDFTD